MLDIFVCEDYAVQRQNIVRIIENTVLMEELDTRLVLETGDPYVLLDKVRDGQNTGIYFLDIDLNNDMNGMKLAQQIRLFDPRGFIIFITAHSELSYMTFSYRVEAMDRKLEFTSTMKELAGALAGDFVRCHRSFLINKNNVKEVDVKNRMIYFTNGESCLMSTRMMKGL